MIISFLWLLFLLCATLYILWRDPLLSLPRHTTWVLISVALFVRLLPNVLLAETTNFDIQSFSLAGEINHLGQDVYTTEATQARHPYLPLQIYALTGSYQLSTHLGWPFPFTVRLLPLFVDALLALFLFRVMRLQISEREAFRWGLVCALNPVTIFVSACHGQFDSIPVALTLAALLSVPRSAWKTGLFLGFAVLDKSWPVLAWPQIMSKLHSWRQRVIVTVLMGAISLVAVSLYAWIFDTSALNSLRKALSYNWGTGIWGYTYFLRMTLMNLPGWPDTWAWFMDISRFITLGVLGWVWFARTRHQTAVRGFFGILLTFFAWGHAFSIQYLLWPVALAVYLRERVWLGRYILAASAYMFLTYYTLIYQNVITRLLPWPQADWYIIMPAAIPVWLVTVFWLRASLQVGDENLMTE